MGTDVIGNDPVGIISSCSSRKSLLMISDGGETYYQLIRTIIDYLIPSKGFLSQVVIMKSRL